MFALLSTNPNSQSEHWLLVTLTVDAAQMEQARGMGTFMLHLKWYWAIAFVYIANCIWGFRVVFYY